MIKNKIIFVGKFGKPSMKTVYGLMQNKDVNLVIRRKHQQEMFNIYSGGVLYRRNPLHINRLAETSIVIRYGNSIVAPFKKGTIVYNKSSSISTASDKALSRQLFTEKGVRCPKLIHYQDYLENKIVYPIIARPRQHRKGQDFVVLNNDQEYLEHYSMNHMYGWYYSEFIDKEKEYRVHCGHGKVLAIMEKPKGEGIAWNRAVVHDPFIRLKQADYLHDLCLQALCAVEAVGLDFGGVDVAYKDNKAYVLEVNTAPTINSSKYVSEQYAKYFDWLTRVDVQREHWDFRQYNKAQSFAWKQEQLLNN